MPVEPAYTRSWSIVGGPYQPMPATLERFWTWGQVRTVMQVTGSGANFAWGAAASHSMKYPTVISAGADLNGKTFRGIPGGIDGAFYTQSQLTPPFDVDWFFFWGGYYEAPPGSGIFVQGIGAGLDQDDMAGALDGATVVCQNATFVTDSSAWNSAGVGQFIASYPAGNPGPGAFVSVITA